MGLRKAGMTLQLKSDRHPSFGPGFALLVFDRPINAIRLEISVFNTITGLYLGASVPGRPSWIKQQTTFFPAVRVGRENSGTFRVGPEITSYIQEGTYVEIATRDGSVREEVSWEGILQRFNLKGTENWFYSANADQLDAGGGGEPQIDEQKQKELEAQRAQQQKDDKARAEKEAVAEKLRAAAAETARIEKENHDRITADALAKTLALEQAAAKAASEAEARRLAEAAAERAANRGIWLKRAGKRLIGAVVVLALAAGGYQAYRSGYLCSQFNLFCDSETLAFRAVQSCAAGKTCGARTCTLPYRNAFPGGPHIANIDRIDHDAGAACLPPVDAEKEMFDRAIGCATEREQSQNNCGVAACFDEFKSRFPASTRLNAEQARLQRNSNACTARNQEKAVLDTAIECASRRPCDTSCFLVYRSRYPNGLFKNDAEAAVARAREACRPPVIPPPHTPTPPPPVVQPPVVNLPQIKRRTDEVPDTDCNRANKPVEQMLCYDGDLAREDGELGAAYKRKIGPLSGGERSALIQRERDWLSHRDLDCGIPASGTWTEMQLRQAKNCLLQKIRDRTNELR